MENHENHKNCQKFKNFEINKKFEDIKMGICFLEKKC